LHLRADDHILVSSDIQPDGSRDIVIVSDLPYAIPDVATKVVHLDVRPGTRVSDFIDLILNRKRHLYEFNSEGQGCGFWVDGQLTLFQDASLLMNGAQIDGARRAVRTQQPYESQYPFFIGSYYPS